MCIPVISKYSLPVISKNLDYQVYEPIRRVRDFITSNKYKSSLPGLSHEPIGCVEFHYHI